MSPQSDRLKGACLTVVRWVLFRSAHRYSVRLGWPNRGLGHLGTREEPAADCFEMIPPVDFFE